MSYFIKQSSATRPLLFLMVLSSDHITGATGLTPTVTLSKAGAAFASPAGAVTEVANGWYQVAANATDSNTLGPLILHATGTAADPVDVIYRVVAFDPDSSTNLGLSNLDAAISSRSTLAAGAQMDLVNAPNATAVTAIQNGLATSSSQTAIKAKTDLIATNSADSPNAATAQSTISTNLNATITSRAAPGAQMDIVNVPNATAVTAIQNGLATATTQTAIKAKTDLIATNSADSPNAVTAQNTISTNLNATISSRTTPGAQMDLVNAPNVTAVTAIQSGLATATSQTAIKAKTDLIGTNSVLPSLAGMTADKAFRVLIALLGGKTTVGSSTVTFLDTDGTTPVLTITYGSTPGSRTAVTIN